MSVPRGWTVKPLNQLADTALGKMLDRGKSRGLVQVPYLRNVNVHWDRIDTSDILTMELADDERERFLVRAGDLLICEGGEVGRAAIWNGREDYLAYQKALHRVRSQGDLDLKFLRYLLEHYRHDGTLARYSTGSTIAHLPQQKLRALPVPHPPLLEQKRIVEILEDHLSRLDAASRSLQWSVQRLLLMRLALLVDVRLRLIADGTGVDPIGALCDTALGKMLDAKNECGEPTPYLRNINIRWGRIDLMDVSVVPLTSAERQRLALRRGDLMVCEGGEPGRCAVWAGDTELMCYQKALHRVRMRDERVDPYFVAAMLEEAVRTGRADRLFTGTTIKHLPQEKLRAAQIPVPAPDVQRSILRKLTDQDTAIQRLDRQIEQETRRTANLRRSLLRAAFTGQLSRPSMEVENTEEMVGV